MNGFLGGRRGLLLVFLGGITVGGVCLDLPARLPSMGARTGWFAAMGQQGGPSFLPTGGLVEAALILAALAVWGLPRRLKVWESGWVTRSMAEEEHVRADLSWIFIVYFGWTTVFQVAWQLGTVFRSMNVELPRLTVLLLSLSELACASRVAWCLPVVVAIAGLAWHRWLYREAAWAGPRWRLLARAWRPVMILGALFLYSLSWTMLWKSFMGLFHCVS